MRRGLRCVALLLALPACLAARADTLFSLQGTLQDGTGTFNGTILYLSNYQSYGRVTGTITDGSFSFTIPSSYLGETIGEGNATHVDVFSVGANYDLSLYLPNSILTGSTGGPLCALSTPCPGFAASSFGDYDGSGNALFATQSFQTLTATPQVTPEPGTFVLLGTGMLALSGVIRRRAFAPHRNPCARLGTGACLHVHPPRGMVSAQAMLSSSLH